MSRSNNPLTQELGEGYVHEFFRGAMFKKDDKVVKIQGCSDGVILTSYLDSTLTPGELSWRSGAMPAEDLKCFADVAWPKLGYRNLLHSKLGNVVVYVTCQRSVLRGIRADHMTW